MPALWLTAYEPPVQRELFRLGHRNLLLNAVADLVLPCVVAGSAWGVVAHATLMAWLAIALAADGVAWLMWWGWRPTARQAGVLPGALPAARLRAWRWTHLITVCLMAGSWGYAGVLYVPGNAVHNLLVITGFQGVLAYSAASNASHDLLAFVVSLVVAGLLMTLYVPLALLHDTAYMDGMLWLFLCALCAVAYNTHRALLLSIRLRLSNEALAVKNAEIAAQAQQANRDKSEFLAAASHDLRQPVHALLLLVEALRAQERDSPAAPQPARAELIGHIGAAGHAIGSLFNALMELSRLESGAEQTLPTDVPLAHMVSQCVDRHALQARQQGLVLRGWTAASLHHAVVHTDRVLLERVLANLLGNALRYTRRGGVLVALRQGRQGALWLEVWDSGIGIAAQHRPRIFDPYFQVANRERDRSKGLGLGLAIVRQATQLLGLAIEVHSQPGRGSRFRIVLPHWQARPVSAAAADAPGAGAAAEVDTGALAHRRVLLIDDDPMVRHAMATLLGRWQIDLRLAAHADDEALQQLQHDGWQPDCILSDYRLPGACHGIELLNRLLDRYPQAVGILQTGELADQVHAAAEDAGYAVLHKPVSPALLASTLRAVLRPRLPP